MCARVAKVSANGDQGVIVPPKSFGQEFRRYTLVLVCSFVTGVAHSQLTGPPRQSFLESFGRVCFQAQRNGSPNTSLPDATLRQYCRCSATYIADTLNNTLAQDIENGRQKMPPHLTEIAAQFCRTNFSRY